MNNSTGKDKYGNTISGEALYNSLNEKQQNSFVNQTDGLASIKFVDGKTALSFVNSVTEFRLDRIIVSANAGLAGELANDSRFSTAPAGQHKPFNDLSYKSNDYPQGNIQFSFNKDRTGVDIDHDLFAPGARHVLEEVFVNYLTGSKTDQDAVRKMLLQNPKIGITPSPDPKFNRPQ